jgi:hypothetical protein
MVREDNKTPTYKDLPPISCLGMLDLPFGHTLSNCPAELALNPTPYKNASQDYDKVLFLSLSISQSISTFVGCCGVSGLRQFWFHTGSAA